MDNNTPNLTQLKDTMHQHKPYAIINMSSTGLDYENDMPIRICVDEYVYSIANGQYRHNLSFDEYIKCDEKSLNHAIEQKDSYDVFANGNINYDNYIKGKINSKEVLETSDFEHRFKDFINMLKPETVFVVNNLNYSIAMLKKVNCNDLIEDKQKDNKILDQINFTQEYFDIKREEGNTDVPSNHYKGNSLNNLSSFLNLNDGKEIKGANVKNKVIAEFIDTYSNEGKILPHQRIRQNDFNKSGNFEYKANKWIRQGIFTPTSVLNRDEKSDINSLFDIFDGKNGYKGFTALQVATTGYDFENQPLQIAVFNFNLQTKQNTALKIDVAIDKYLFESIKQNPKTDGFDILSFAEIDINKYEEALKKPLLSENYKEIEKEDKLKSGQSYHVYSKEATLMKLKSFFKAYNPKEFPVIMDNLRFNEKVLSQLSDSPRYEYNHDYNKNKLDFANITKEYCYLTANDKSYKDKPNCLGFKGSEDYCDKNISLKQIRENLINNENPEDDKDNCGDTLTRCSLMGALITQIGEQYEEISINNLINEITDERNISIEEGNDGISDDGIESIPIPFTNKQPESVRRNTNNYSKSLSESLLRNEIEENEFLEKQELLLDNEPNNLQNTIVKISDNLVELSKNNTEIINKMSENFVKLSETNAELVKKNNELVFKLAEMCQSFMDLAKREFEKGQEKKSNEKDYEQQRK